jgi:hypothetical protein
MTFDRLDVVVPSEASISVHDECYMLGDGALFEGADEELPQLTSSPDCGRRRCEPLSDSGVVE